LAWIALHSLLLHIFSVADAVDYSKYALWEKRTLRCGGNLCTLEGTGQWMKEDLAELGYVFFSGVTRQLCGIKCTGADRDSVISKKPMWNHKCVRFSTYDTLERNQEWFIWRSGSCTQQNITLEVHCGFPEKQRK
ncbi:hypothetical protein PENTCL1PPCAC_10301, partial [Pristionchus entomophagus]